MLFLWEIGQFAGRVTCCKSQLPAIFRLQEPVPVISLVFLGCQLPALSLQLCLHSLQRWACCVPVSERKNLLVLFGFQTIYTETSL